MLRDSLSIVSQLCHCVGRVFILQLTHLSKGKAPRMSTLFGDTRSHSVGLPTIMSIRSFSDFFKTIRAPPVKVLTKF